MLIPREHIRPNEWNPNAFDPAIYPKLVESVRERGIMEPLKVMPDPAGDEAYLLVDGYHRWLAAGELGIAELPCEVWEISQEEAKIRGLQLNYLRGQPVPVRLGRLLHDLNGTYGIDDLAGMLPWTRGEIEEAVQLTRLPPDIEERLQGEAAEQAARAPVPVTVVLVGGEFNSFDRAMNIAKEHLGRNARRGQCLAHICDAYLRRGDESGVGGEP